MKIFGKHIRRAKTIRKILQSRPVDYQYFDRLLTIYECRLFGLCIYRTTHSFDKLKYKFINGDVNSERGTSDRIKP